MIHDSQGESDLARHGVASGLLQETRILSAAFFGKGKRSNGEAAEESTVLGDGGDLKS